MPALVNIKVGSLRGTNGEDDTISWPFSAKKFRKVDLISLTPLMFIQSGVLGPATRHPNRKFRLISADRWLLDKASFAVQKLCREIRGLPQARNPVERLKARVDRLGRPVVCTYLYCTATSGETGLIAGAEGATAPETLR